MVRLMIFRRLTTLAAGFAAVVLASCTLPDEGPPAQPVVYASQPQSPDQLPYQPPRQSLSFSSPSNVAPQAPPVHAVSYILVNARNGCVLAARDADQPRHVASTQKLLTGLIVAESGNLDAPVRITEADVSVEPSKLGIRPGEVYSRRTLLTAFLVKSANDVAAALARDNAGSIEAFAQRMNERARIAGATNSYFANPHGLTAPGQHSTARDMALIALAAHRNSVLQDVVRRKYYQFQFASGRVETLKNTNELLGVMPECDGMKTGYTGPAGRCLVSSAHSGDRDVILVQLGTQTRYIWADGAVLMRWGLERS